MIFDCDLGDLYLRVNYLLNYVTFSLGILLYCITLSDAQATNCLFFFLSVKQMNLQPIRRQMILKTMELRHFCISWRLTYSKLVHFTIKVRAIRLVTVHRSRRLYLVKCILLKSRS